MSHSPFSVLASRNFRLYWAGQAVSLVGTWMQVMAQGWVLTNLSPDAWVLGMFNVAGSLPMLVLGIKGGEIADRLDKRLILLWTQVAMMVLALGFAGLVWSGALQLWHVFAFGLVISVVEAFEFPASQGFAPELVEPAQIPAAVATMQTIFQAGRLVGPPLAGVLISRVGEASAFAVNGLSFLAVIASLLLIRRPARPVAVDTPQQRESQRFVEGYRYVKGDPVSRAMLMVLMLAMVLVLPTLVLMPYYGRHLLNADATGMGELMSASGVGALAGSLLLLRLDPRRHLRWIGAATLGIVCSLLGLAWAPGVTVALAFAGGLQGSMAILMGSVNQTVQGRVPAELRGRVTALFGMVFTSVLPFSAMAVTALADVVGLQPLMVGCALMFGVACSLLLWRARVPAATSG
jgi:MFS family permease